MRVIFLMLSALAFGCASRSDYLLPTYGAEFYISISEGKMPNPRQIAFANIKSVNGKTVSCEITLERYPVCLLHELRHCIEGHWHPRDEPNTEDC